MPTKDILVSQKFNNYNYAPGIATYGIDGKTGESGKDGNNIYFTDFNLKDITDLKYFASQLIQNYLPLENSTVQIERTYKNNDLFFDQLGIIYRLKNIESLLNNDSLTSWDSYFDVAGRLSIANNSSLFTMMDDNRLILNSSLYGGYDIISGLSYNDASNNINKNSVVNIISNKVNENNDIEMLNIQSIDDIDVEDGKLSVYYKTTENAFYLDSNKPIIINGDVKLNNEEPNIEYDNYSTILTSNDTISYFKYVCDQLRYTITYDSDVNRYKIIIYQIDGKSDKLEYLIKRNETIFGKIYTSDNDQVLLELDEIADTSILYNIGVDEVIKNGCNIIGDEELPLPMELISVTDNIIDNKLNIDIEFDGSPTDMPLAFGSFGIRVKAIQEDHPIVYQNYYDASSYTFNFNGKSKLSLCFRPKVEYYVSANWEDEPIEIKLNTQDLLDKQYILNFTQAIQSNTEFKISNISITSSGKIKGFETYLPDSVESVQRFSLLHNTEVFINYQE